MVQHSKLKQWLSDHRPEMGYRAEALGGGCINRSSRVVFDDGTRLVVKENGATPEDMFEAEAAGLAALAVNPGLRTPAVMAVDARFIVLEDLGQGRPDGGYWEELGAGLARLHQLQQPQFGFTMDNYCGLTRQANPMTADGHEFFVEHRLMALGRRCKERGLLEGRDMKRLEFLAAHLQRWIPVQPAVLVHGDLWSGNIHCCDDGAAALIDPAAYWGWAEAELAMTRLFGGFAPEFYASYQAAAGIGADWEERCDIYNLYHLLNHLLLFGGSYLGQVRGVLNAYAD